MARTAQLQQTIDEPENDMAFVNEKENSRTIDHERGFMLISKGGARPDAIDRHVFELRLGNDVVTIDTKVNIDTVDSKTKISWLITRVNPSHIKNFSEEEISQIMREALTEYGMFYEKSRADEVHVI